MTGNERRMADNGMTADVTAGDWNAGGGLSGRERTCMGRLKAAFRRTKGGLQLPG